MSYQIQHGDFTVTCDTASEVAALIQQLRQRDHADPPANQPRSKSWDDTSPRAQFNDLMKVLTKPTRLMLFQLLDSPESFTLSRQELAKLLGTNTRGVSQRLRFLKAIAENHSLSPKQVIYHLPGDQIRLNAVFAGYLRKHYREKPR